MSEAIMKFQPVLPLRAISEFMTKEEQGSLLMSVVYTITREHGDIVGLGNCHQTMWMFSGCAELVPPLTGSGALESWPQLSLEAAL